MPTAIIFGAQSKTCRRVVYTDEHESKLMLHLGKGEGMIVIGTEVTANAGLRLVNGDDRPLFRVTDAGNRIILNPEAIDALIEQVTGVKPASARCVALDGDLTVAQIEMADPLLDTVSSGMLVREEEAIPGDVLQPDGKFYRRYKDGELRLPEEIRALDAIETAKIIDAAKVEAAPADEAAVDAK